VSSAGADLRKQGAASAAGAGWRSCQRAACSNAAWDARDGWLGSAACLSTWAAARMPAALLLRAQRCTRARRCKARGASVQGAVTAATMVATAAAQAAGHPLPQTLVMQCPADVRKQVRAPQCLCALGHVRMLSARLERMWGLGVVATLPYSGCSGSGGQARMRHCHFAQATAGMCSEACLPPAAMHMGRLAPLFQYPRALQRVSGQGLARLWHVTGIARRAQVDPPVPAAGVAAGCALLVWPQRLAAADLLWDVAAAAGAAVRREHAAQGGLAFWKRLHADRTMAEVAGMAAPPFLPPFTARMPLCPTRRACPCVDNRVPLHLCPTACVLPKPNPTL